MNACAAIALSLIAGRGVVRGGGAIRFAVNSFHALRQSVNRPARQKRPKSARTRLIVSRSVVPSSAPNVALGTPLIRPQTVSSDRRRSPLRRVGGRLSG